jgi:hypothetical protein
LNGVELREILLEKKTLKLIALKKVLLEKEVNLKKKIK